MSWVFWLTTAKYYFIDFFQFVSCIFSPFLLQKICSLSSWLLQFLFFSVVFFSTSFFFKNGLVDIFLFIDSLNSKFFVNIFSWSLLLSRSKSLLFCWLFLFSFFCFVLFCFILTKNKIKQNEIKWLLFLSCITFASAAAIWSKTELLSCFCKFLLGNFFAVSLSRKKVFNLFRLNSLLNFFISFFSLGKILFVCQWISNYFAVSFCFLLLNFICGSRYLYSRKVVIIFILFIHVMYSTFFMLVS